MESAQDHQATSPQEPADIPPLYFEARDALAGRFLRGEGLEIGPLHLPLPLPSHATARYVDRMPVEELRSEYPELADLELTRVDVVDDGERLETIPDGSVDFIVANHFLEHTEDPIGTIAVHLRKLRPGGVLFYAVPDKRFTFDFRREPTPLDHMVTDHEQGPEGSRQAHYEEWARLVGDEDSPATGSDAGSKQAPTAGELEAASYSIHMHVWTQAEFLKLILHCRERLEDAFDIEAAARQGPEFIVVLRKQGSFPDPSPASAALDGAAGGPLSDLEAANQQLAEEVRGMTGSLSWRLTKPLRSTKRGLGRLKRRRR